MQSDFLPPALKRLLLAPFVLRSPDSLGMPGCHSCCHVPHLQDSTSLLLSWRISRAVPGIIGPEHLSPSDRAGPGLGMDGEERRAQNRGKQCLHSEGVYTFSGSCSRNQQAILQEAIVSQAKQDSVSAGSFLFLSTWAGSQPSSDNDTPHKDTPRHTPSALHNRRAGRNPPDSRLGL